MQKIPINILHSSLFLNFKARCKMLFFSDYDKSMKLILVEVESCYAYNDSCDVKSKVKVIESAAELANLASKFSHEFFNELLKTASFQNSLSSQGWVKSTKEIDGNLVYEEQIYLARSSHYSSGVHLNKIDLQSLKVHEIQDIAEGALVVRGISLESIKAIAPETYKLVMKKVQAHKKTEKLAADRKAKLAAKKALTKIEKAKKLLESQGLTVK